MAEYQAFVTTLLTVTSILGAFTTTGFIALFIDLERSKSKESLTKIERTNAPDISHLFLLRELNLLRWASFSFIFVSISLTSITLARLNGAAEILLPYIYLALFAFVLALMLTLFSLYKPKKYQNDDAESIIDVSGSRAINGSSHMIIPFAIVGICVYEILAMVHWYIFYTEKNLGWILTFLLFLILVDGFIAEKNE